MTVPPGATDAEVRAAMSGVPPQVLHAPPFLRRAFTVVAGVLVLAVAVLAAQTVAGDGPGLLSWAVLVPLAIVACAAAAGVRRTRVELGPEGVRASVGGLRHVRWEQVEHVRVSFRPGTATTITLEHGGRAMPLSSSAVEPVPVLRAVLALRAVRPGLLDARDEEQLDRALARWQP